VSFEIAAHDGELKIHLTADKGHPIHYYPLQAERSFGNSNSEGPADLMLFTKHFQLNPAVNRAVEAIGDLEVSADIIHLRRIPEKRRTLAKRKLQLQAFNNFMRQKWQDHYREVRKVDAEYLHVTKCLINARVSERAELYLSYFDDHQHLQNPTSCNSLIRENWKHLYDHIRKLSSVLKIAYFLLKCLKIVSRQSRYFQGKSRVSRVSRPYFLYLSYS
jgi:hypothetical protein